MHSDTTQSEPTRGPRLLSALLAAGPLLLMSLSLGAAWAGGATPARAEWTAYAEQLLVLEFLLLHSGVFIGAAAASTGRPGYRLRLLVTQGVMCALLAAVVALSMRSAAMFGLFALVSAGRFWTVATTPRESAGTFHLRAFAGVGLYLGLAGLWVLERETGWFGIDRALGALPMMTLYYVLSATVETWLAWHGQAAAPRRRGTEAVRTGPARLAPRIVGRHRQGLLFLAVWAAFTLLGLALLVGNNVGDPFAWIAMLLVLAAGVAVAVYEIRQRRELEHFGGIGLEIERYPVPIGGELAGHVAFPRNVPVGVTATFEATCTCLWAEPYVTVKGEKSQRKRTETLWEARQSVRTERAVRGARAAVTLPVPDGLHPSESPGPFMQNDYRYYEWTLTVTVPGIGGEVRRTFEFEAR